MNCVNFPLPVHTWDTFQFRVLIKFLVKEQVKRFEGLYVQRDELVSKIPDFWLRVVRRTLLREADPSSLNSFSTLSSIETPNIEDFDV